MESKHVILGRANAEVGHPHVGPIRFADGRSQRSSAVADPTAARSGHLAEGQRRVRSARRRRRLVTHVASLLSAGMQGFLTLSRRIGRQSIRST